MLFRSFTNTKGNTIPPSEAIERLDKMAESLGEKIDKEKNLITSLLQSDKQKLNL